MARVGSQLGPLGTERKAKRQDFRDILAPEKMMTDEILGIFLVFSIHGHSKEICTCILCMRACVILHTYLQEVSLVTSISVRFADSI